jgi:ElaB/YqjD/DUF883 family membrane-anchored ribosome-binding protein
MGRIDKLRENTNAFLDKLEAKIDAIEKTMNHSKTEAQEYFEKAKASFLDDLNKAQQKLDDAKEFSAEQKHTLKGKFDHLKVQLALGKTETKEEFYEQRKKIRNAMHDLDNEIEADINAFDTFIGEQWNRFDEDLEEIETGFKGKVSNLKDKASNKKEEINKSINDLRKKIKAKKESTQGKASDINKEFQDHFKQVKSIIKESREDE